MTVDSLQGKTALVTGAAKRLGRATALLLAAEGANVIVHYHRSAAEAEALCHELQGRGVRAWPLQAAFESSTDYEGLVREALQLAGRLDMLINNASVYPAESLAALSFQSLVGNVHVNSWAPFALSRAFAQHTEQGKIINLLDTRVRGYDWWHTGYILSKHLLAVLTRMMALELAPRIRVNAVAPGLVLPPPGKDENYLERLKDTVPMKCHGDPDDVAQAIVFLLKSRFITGQTIYVDGGRHLKEGHDGPHTD